MSASRRHALGVGCVALIAIAAFVLPAGTAVAGSSQSAKQWAGGVCTAFLDFGDSVQSTIDGLKGASSVQSAADSAKQGINSAVQDLQSSLDDLGKPPTPNAKAAQSAIQDLGDELEKDAAAIQSDLTPAPSTPSEIAGTFAAIGNEMQKAVSQAKSTASTLQGLKGNDELKQGFESASSCQQLKKNL